MSDSQQRLLSTLLSGIPGMLVLKNSDLRYEVVNPAFCQFLGKAPNEVIGKTAQDLYSAEEAGQVEAADREVLKKARPQSAEHQISGIDGKRWFEISRSPILDDDGVAVGLLMVAVDITGYKEKMGTGGGGAENEQLLNEAEAKLSELLNQLQAAQSKTSEAEKNARALTVKLGDMETKVAEAERKGKQLNELNEKVAAAEKKTQEAEAKIKQLEGSAGASAEVQAALASKTQESEKYLADYLATLKQLEELRTWAQQAQYQYGELQKICKAAETDRDRYKSELLPLRAELALAQNSKGAVDAAQQEAESLKAQLAAAQQNTATLEEEIAKLKQAKKDIADLLKRINPDE